jgi:hypothetical protein
LIIGPFKRKILKITAYILGCLVGLLTIFHFWFINHAEKLIEELVASRSNGKLKLKVKKFKFNWFSYDMQLRHAVFYSTDTNTASTSYRFNVDRINIRVKAIMPLVFEKKFLIDSLSLLNPDIEVTRLRSTKDTTTDAADTSKDKSVSLTKEMGRVYNSIQDALQILQVNRFQIDNGKFRLVNKIQTDELPVTITNIYFHLDNLQVDTNKLAAKQKILFSDNVALRTHDQDILFPDGRHRLTFKNFGINIQKRMVEFDSCTIAASKGDSARRSFSVFFDKLLLTNIDFDTLYQKEVIRADSVYCINPRFKLDVELEKRTGQRKPRPKLDELIQQLTGDLQLAFVVVNNGSFDINTIRDGNPSSFTSDHNNFEVQGLRIQKNSPKPFTVESFAMAIRNYENFLKDSTYAMQFDSILLLNNSIYLSNFSFKQMNQGKVINNFSMPQFVLTGLSWDDLVFERKLTARKASLYKPVINYSVLANNKKQDIFQALTVMGDIIHLNNLDITNGQINIHFREGSQLQLENASMSVFSQSLLDSRRIGNLQRSVSALSFKKGMFKQNDVMARMENVNFTGTNGRLTAGAVFISSKEKKLDIDAKNVVINKMMIDNNSSVTELDGISWQEADVKISGPSEKKSLPGGFVLKNIKGGNTKLRFHNGNLELNAFLQTISASELDTRSRKGIQIINLGATGKNFSFTDNNLQLKADRFGFTDGQNSFLQNVAFTSNTINDSISVVLPTISLVPDINALIDGAIVADNIKLVQPRIFVKQLLMAETAGIEGMKLPKVSINRITVQQPELHLLQSGNKEMAIEWLGRTESNNFFELTDFKIANDPSSKISAGQFQVALNNFSLTTNGKRFTTGKGSLNTRITGLYIDSMQTGEWDWQGTIADLQVKDILLDTLGKQSGRLEIRSAKLNDLAIKSSSFLNIRQLLKENTAFRLKEVTGQYDDVNSHFDWLNLNYDKNSKILSVDSFTFRPAAGRDSFMAGQKFQTDFITLNTGAVDVGPFDIDKYLTDTVVNAGTVIVHNANLTNFRDKRMPARDKIIKPLPVNLLKKIPVRLSLDTLILRNTNIEYAELNEKTNQTGTVTINRMTAKAFPVNNYDQHEGDSLHLEAQAWLMDSVGILLKLRESYTDSLAGFLMSVTMRPADIRILNPILIPLASVKLESGYLDTLSMRVVGREYLSLGEMQMFYHDLKIRLLTNGTEKKKAFLKGLITFIANTFIIKKNNSSRTGVIFFERIRNKSAMNYLVKIALSGVASSVGIKKNKKRLRKRNLPPIDYDMTVSAMQ